MRYPVDWRNKKMRFIQINLNYCWVAQNLFEQITHQSEVEIAIMSEPPSQWRMVYRFDGRQTIQYTMNQAANGLEWTEICGVYVYSCHALCDTV